MRCCLSWALQGAHGSAEELGDGVMREERVLGGAPRALLGGEWELQGVPRPGWPARACVASKLLSRLPIRL